MDQIKTFAKFAFKVVLVLVVIGFIRDSTFVPEPVKQLMVRFGI